ncbi:putative ABC transport system permease protein [Tenacibaculum adriaticum]|uniref:Putative ABC transport system permease protein n=1 Tax=Tenacibaculum adriaticum TaxID=413713 RepID=A0A5S5DR21_9FLAO|nr:ABC transporter permease [Tenacibaculum adriaticum]TYP98341.1 putative ABC transport system permease protein [Tenacibaculum adriaticum]
MLQTWFKIFFRNLQKNWLNSLVNISGLTLGLAGLIIVLLYINEEKSYNKWNPNKDDVYRIYNHTDRNGTWSVGTPAQAVVFKSDIPEVEDVLMVDHFYRDFIVDHDGNKMYSEKIAVSEPNFFAFFPFKIKAGSYSSFEKTRNQVALSKEFSNKLFGNESGVGQTVTINNRECIVAVVYTISGKSHYQPEVVLQFENPLPKNHWGNFMYAMFCKLTPDTDIKEVSKKMNNVIIERRHKPHAKEGGITIEEYEKRLGFMTVRYAKLADLRLQTVLLDGGPEGKGNKQLLYVLLGLSILLILISCVNFINLSTASATQRAKEVGVKKTLGLSKKQLILQYISEIVLQVFISFVFALILVELILPYFNQFVKTDMSILNTKVLSIVFLIVVLVSLFIGSIPALYLSNFKAIEVLKGSFSKSKKGVFARNVMLGIQFLISGFFLIGMLIIQVQMQFIINKDVGFSKEQIVAIKINRIGNEYAKYELFKKEIVKNPNVMEASYSLFVPGKGYINGTDFQYKEVPGFSAAVNLSDYNYLDFAGIKVLKGRSFSEKFASDTINKIIVNETLAKRIGVYDNPIGKKAKIGWSNEREFEIVGMIQDYHFSGFDVKIEPMFLMHPKAFSRFVNRMLAVQVKIKMENVDKTMLEIEEFWKQNIDNDYPFTYEFLDKIFAETYEKYKKQQTMFLILSVLVITIALLGLFALATLTIQQRLKEVAIRKTLGASVKEIMFQLLKSFLKIVLISSVALIPIAYFFMQNWLENFVYRIDMPILPYIITPLILIVLVFAVVGLKAYNATKVDLIKYLKFE